jgi:hypothetical protein
MMRSSAKRERWTDRRDAHDRVSMMKSRSETASMLLGVGPEKPRALASAARSSPKACPASAPLPSGIMLMRRATSEALSASLCHELA